VVHGRNARLWDTETADTLREATMQYLVELKLSAGSRPNTWAEGRAFIENSILPTLEHCERLMEEKKIIAGGPQSGAVALSLIVEAATVGELDEVITSLPVWPRMETSVIPLTTFEDRRRSILALHQTVNSGASEKSTAR
jgi:muconolactone delta-isomerase